MGICAGIGQGGFGAPWCGKFGSRERAKFAKFLPSNLKRGGEISNFALLNFGRCGGEISNFALLNLGAKFTNFVPLNLRYLDVKFANFAPCPPANFSNFSARG